MQWLRVEGYYVVLKEDNEFAINGKQKGSVREERPMQFLARES